MVTSSGGFSSYLDSLANFGIEPSLEGIRALCRELGDPQKSFNIIQVTGTNGKTSTARMIQALLTDHGTSCGLYVSPHLESYRERIGIDGEDIGKADFEDIGRLIEAKIKTAEESLGGRHITQFEAITAAGLAYFARRGARVAVVEVGMGGRWDATSVVPAAVAVITNVTMDHADWLGPELADIAAEKAGVIKSGNIAVIGDIGDDIKTVFEKRAEAQESTVLFAGRDFSIDRFSKEGFSLKTPLSVYSDISVCVGGPWQSRNALLAVMAAEAYLKSKLDENKARQALKNVRCPGRAELVKGDPDILLDGAHNEAGMEALIDYLRQNFSNRRAVLLVSILRDKSAPQMIEQLCRFSKRIVFTASTNPRCLQTDELAKLARRYGVDTIQESDLSSALACAKREAGGGGKDFVVATGSLYLVGEVRKLLKNQGVIFP